MLFVAWQSKSLANGGIQSLTEILRGLVGKVHRIVITLSNGPATQVFRDLGCEVHVWEVERDAGVRGAALALSRARRMPAVLFENARLAKLVRDRGVRVVHCNDITAFWFAAPGARLVGARVILNIRSMFPPDVPYGPRWRAAHLLANDIVCLSSGMRDEVRDRMNLPPRIDAVTPTSKRAALRVIESSVDLERMRPASATEKATCREALDVPTERPLVAYVGAFSEFKNQLGFIEHVVPRLVAAVPDVLVLFVGDFDPSASSYASRCAARVEALGLGPNVRFHGYVRDASSVYRAADVVALTSRFEGLARCMIESLACAVPFVSFDVTSAREFLEEKGTGVAVAWGAYDEVAAAIARLLTSPEECAALGRRGRDVALATFDRVRAIAKYEALYA